VKHDPQEAALAGGTGRASPEGEIIEAHGGSMRIQGRQGGGTALTAEA